MLQRAGGTSHARVLRLLRPGGTLALRLRIRPAGSAFSASRPRYAAARRHGSGLAEAAVRLPSLYITSATVS